MIIIAIEVSVGEQHGRKVVSPEKDGHRLMYSYELTHDLQTGYIRLGTDNSAIPPASAPPSQFVHVHFDDERKRPQVFLGPN